jgi:DNA-binding transcriptional LysR family regulator
MNDANSAPTPLLEIDGRMLRTFLTVLETGSVTQAAKRLGVTQSAVSHALERLRAALGDPLFVKSGRGIVATARAEDLAAPARQMLADLQRLARASRFVPEEASLALTVAANDFQRDLLLPVFCQRVTARTRTFSLRIIPSRAPTAEMLRDGRCDLIITPRPPEGSDVLQKRLLVDHFACFFDPSRRAGPVNLEEYLAASHVTVVHEDGRRLEFDEWLGARGLARRVAIAVPDFAGIAAFLRGTNLLASVPSRLGQGPLQSLAAVPLPFSAPALSMFLVWHRRDHDDSAHVWLRAQLEDAVKETLTVPGAS